MVNSMRSCVLSAALTMVAATESGPTVTPDAYYSLHTGSIHYNMAFVSKYVRSALSSCPRCSYSMFPCCSIPFFGAPDVTSNTPIDANARSLVGPYSGRKIWFVGL